MRRWRCADVFVAAGGGESPDVEKNGARERFIEKVLRNSYSTGNAAFRLKSLDLGDGDKEAAGKHNVFDSPLPNGPAHAFNVPRPPLGNLARREILAAVGFAGGSVHGGPAACRLFYLVNHLQFLPVHSLQYAAKASTRLTAKANHNPTANVLRFRSNFQGDFSNKLPKPERGDWGKKFGVWPSASVRLILDSNWCSLKTKLDTGFSTRACAILLQEGRTFRQVLLAKIFHGFTVNGFPMPAEFREYWRVVLQPGAEQCQAVLFLGFWPECAQTHEKEFLVEGELREDLQHG